MPDNGLSTDCVPPPTGTYLGFDYGLKRIGVASGNTHTGTAMPVDTVRNKHGTADWQAIDKLVKLWTPVGLVAGVPLQMDGAKQEMTNYANGFIRQLKRRYELPVYGADERMSSKEAELVIKKNRQSGARGKTQKPEIDKIAATLILQRWLDNQ